MHPGRRILPAGEGCRPLGFLGLPERAWVDYFLVSIFTTICKYLRKVAHMDFALVDRKFDSQLNV
jgi:hypothetical protein